MCGIAGLIRLRGSETGTGVVEAMTEAVRHRGPDGAGTTYLARGDNRLDDLGAAPNRPWQVALGHRRLSIIDLSVDGNQPMCYRGRHWMTYNGELYNYLELRAELEKLGQPFHSQSDSEVILAAYDQWGPDCFARFRGMWGLVIIDAQRQTAVLSRDRLGIKPLYLARTDDLLAFGSEIKQFFSVPSLKMRPDEGVLADYLTTGYDQEGPTFFAGVQAVAPATWIQVDLKTGDISQPREYWFPERVAVSVDDADEAGRLLRAEFETSVRIHLRSDVPVGCALSGGLDSSSIAACVGQLNAASEHKLETFSVIFPGNAIDEQDFARQVADTVRSTPHYITPSAAGFLDDLDRMLWIHDEPVGSLSQYAAYVLARLTREAGVPVTLNGQGGDEVLGGYWQSYFMYLRNLLRSGRWLRLTRHFAGAALPGGNSQLLRQTAGMVRRYRARQKAVSTSNGAGGGRNGKSHDRLRRLMDMNEQERRVFDIRVMYLPRLLKWDDRNFMAFAVEGRYPFLDHQLIELALSFAPDLLYRRGWTKEPLRSGLRGLLAPSILRRRTKFGFETPQGEWLCGDLRPAIEQWLKGDAPLWQYVDRKYVRQVAEETWGQNGRREEPVQELMRFYLADRWLRVFFH